MSELNSNIENKGQNLNKAFDEWDAGTPTGDLWSKLDESIATEHVWSKLDDTLKAHGSNPDAWLVSAHQDWSANTNADGWNKLEEELSRERVWKRLHHTLSKPVSLDFPWGKVAASLLLFFSLSYYMSDAPLMTSVANDSFINRQFVAAVDQPTTTPVAITDKNSTDNNQPAISEKTDRQVQNVNLANNTPIVVIPDNKKISIITPVENRPQDNVIASTNENPENAFLGRKNLPAFALTGNPDMILVPPGAKRPSWTLSLGTQLSILTEENKSSYTNSLPKFGFAGDLAFNKNFGRLRFSQSIGYTQFAQANGKYINGRYLNTQQRLGAVQLNTSLGFQLNNRFTINGGLLFTRLMSGTEQQQNTNTIVNVYNVSKIQPGLTAGLEYNLRPVNKKVQVGIGAQYQWVPQVATANVVFNDIQGVRLQTKISF